MRSPCPHDAAGGGILPSSARITVQLGSQPSETAGDPACDGPGRDRESFADGAVALVACEEPVENLLALGAEVGEAVANEHRLVETGDRVVRGPFVDLLHRHDPARPAQQVETAVACQLSDPGADRVI